MIRKNLFSILVALVILYLSLASSSTFERVHVFNIPYMDKIVHAIMYFGLMSTIIFENKKSMLIIRKILLTALIPFSYGILMEILQATITTSRSGNVFDALANLAGIVISIILWFFISPLLMKEKVR